jgi:hypothetical protein
MNQAGRERSVLWWFLVLAGTFLVTTGVGIGLMVLIQGLPPAGTPPGPSPGEPQPAVASDPPPTPEIPIKDTVSILSLMAKDLDGRPDFQARQRRYLSFAHLSRFKTVPNEERQGYHAALRSLAALYKPAAPDDVFTPLDAGPVVYGFNLADLDWEDDGRWDQVLRTYPYGLHHRRAANLRLRELELQLERLTDCPFPWVRGDWFLAAISRPPLGGPMGELKLPGPLPDRVTALGETYRHRELDVADLAADLGYTDVKRLEEFLATESDLRRLAGFENAEAKTVRRATWETFRGGATSPFQDTARKLGLGEPDRVK